MAFVNPNVLAKIFGQNGAINTASPDKQQAMIQMLAGAGSGMTQAANQPGANFAQALGGGAQGMVQGQMNAQQMQMQQMQMQQMQQEMDRQERINKIMGDILNPRIKGGFAGQVDAQLPTTPQIGQATATPYQGAGAMSAQYESGGGGVSTVSTGRGDPGGPSYGTHQLSSNAGTMQSFLQSPEGQPFAQHFSGQQPGTPQFNQSYQEVVAGAGPQLEQAQRQFLERTHVQPVMAAAQQAGIPVDNPGIQQALYSQAIQHSGDGNVQILNEAAARLPQNASPEQVIDAIYDAREPYAIRALERDGADPDVIEGVRNRYRQERQQAKAALGPRQVGGRIGAEVQQAAQQAPLNGYQQRAAQAQANDPLAGLPAGTRQLLSLLPGEDAARVLVDMQTGGGGETPARIQEAQMIAAQTGEPVGTVLARMRKIMPGGEDGLTTANQTREQTIEALIANDPSADPQAIRDAIYGRRKVSRDPVSGRAEVVDVVTGETIRGASVADAERAEAAAADAELMSTIVPEGMDVSLGMGASGFWANIANTALGAVGLNPMAPQAEQAIQAMNNLKTQTMVALAEEVAGKPSNYLLEQFERIAPSPANLLQGDARAREKLRTTSALIDDKLRMVNDVVNNPHEYRPTTVDKARQNKLKLEALKRQYDTAYENFGTGGQQSGPGGADPEVDALINRWAD